MALRILIIPDKFKGSLDAARVARAIARGWKRSRPGDRVECLPMSDGGDGFGETMRGVRGARRVTTRTRDAAGRPCTAVWFHQATDRLAIVESARVVGLAMLPPGRYHPTQLDTSGMAPVLSAAWRRGCRRCLVGLGGSATNDGGLGLARALGYRFVDAAGRAIETWAELHRLDRIISPATPPLRGMRVVAVVDVRNPLLGRRGCSRIYGPQKGLRGHEIERSDAALRQLARVVRSHFGADVARVPGAGAAGGLGFGLVAFLRADVRPGFEEFSRASRLRSRLRSIDLVITGEGALDPSSLMGKGVGEVARLCRRLRIPCVALAGQMGDSSSVRKWFRAWGALTPDLAPPPDARQRASHWLAEAARRLARSEVIERIEKSFIPGSKLR